MFFSRRIKSILLVCAGTLILAFGMAVFLIPYELITGGATGMAIVLSLVLPGPFFSVDRIVFLLTWALFLLGWMFLGRDFALKTLISSALYPIALSLLLHLTQLEAVAALLDLRRSSHADLALLVSALLGGALTGIGCALTFLGGGSTGGTDILAFLICRRIPKLRSTSVLFAIDAAIILCGVPVLGDLVLSLLGVCSALTCSMLIDRVFLGGDRALVAQIVSNEREAISRAVVERLSRTTTVFSARGGYTGRETFVISVSLPVRQYAALMQIVEEIDPHAFLSVYRAYEVRGEGWHEKRWALEKHRHAVTNLENR